MADPIVDAFVRQYTSLGTVEQRDQLARDFVIQVEQQSDNYITATERVVRAGTTLDQDFTRYLSRFQRQTPSPTALQNVQQAVEDAKGNASWLDRTKARSLATLDWYQKNVVEVSAANATNFVLEQLPGNTTLEKNIDEAINRMAAARQTDTNSLTLAERNQAIGDAWRQTNMVWGLKGGLELLFDPLNLVGLGLPGKVMTRVPGLRPLLAPLQAIDQLPDATVRRALAIPGAAVRKTPGLRRLADPAESTRIIRLRNNVAAEVRAAYDPQSLLANDTAATRSVFSNLTRYPADANPYSLRNVMGHIEDSVNASQKTIRREADGVIEEILPFEDFKEKLFQMTPDQAAEFIAARVVVQERAALRAGGKLLAGDVISKEASKIGQREARKKAFGDLGEKLAQDRKWGRAVGEAIDGAINGLWTTYTRKVEPMVLRPWTLLHLVSVGYLPFNLIEDVGYATVGMGTNPTGLSGDMLRLMTQGITDPDAIPPAFLNLGRKADLGMDQLALGVYEVGENADSGATKYIRELGIKQSGQGGIHIQGQAWGREYLRQFNKVLAENGVSSAEIDGFRDFIRNEIPTNLGSSAEDIALATWTASTGGPAAIRQLKDVMTIERMIRKGQHSILSEFPELLPDIRRHLRRIIDEKGGLKAEDVESVLEQSRNEIIKWHRFTEEGLDAHYGSALNAIGQRAPSSGAEALSMLRWMQWGADGLKSLPREMSARFAAEASALPPTERGKVWERMREEIPAKMSKLRATYEAMIERARPKVQAALDADKKFRASTTEPVRTSLKASIDNYFDLQKQVGARAQEAAENVRSLSQQLFDDTPATERNSAWWDDYRRQVSNIWDSQYEDTMALYQESTDAWTGIFGIAKPSQLNEREREFMLKGVEATLGEAHQRRDEIIHILTRLEDSLPTASPTTANIVQQRIETLKTRAIVNEDRIRQLTARRDEFVGNIRRSVTPTRMAEIETGISAQVKTIKLLQEKGFTELLPAAQETLRLARVERQQMIREMLPNDLRSQYDTFTKAIDDIDQRLTAPGLSDRNRVSLEAQQRRLRGQLNRMETAIKRGETARDLGQVGPVTLRSQQEAALAALRANGGQLPATLEDMETLLLNLSDAGDSSVLPLVRELSEGISFSEEVLQRVYAEAAKYSSAPRLSSGQLDLLKQVYEKGGAGIYPTRSLVELSEQGLVEQPRAIAGTGRVSVKLTDSGQTALSTPPASDIPLEEIEASAQAFDDSVSAMLTQAQTAVSRMVAVADNPPLSQAGAESAARFYERVAAEMERRGDFAQNIANAKVEAGRRANTSFKENFTDYDTRTTFDVAMTHVMPFWMYASRKWPRMIRLAGKRPILGKYMAQIAMDDEYGWVPTPWGDDFSPFKGTMIGGWRRAAYRDFPERSPGFGGFLENTNDWLGRFGFNPNPALTGLLNRITGEDAASLPPPISLLAQGYIAAGGDLPGGMDEFFFDSRLLEYQMDTVLAETFKKDPVDIRRAASEGDEEAMAQMQVARMEAARVVIRTSQTGIFNYRPAGKREFQGTTEAFIADALGVDEEYQRKLRTLGVPLSSVIPISKYQRRILREQMGDDRYEAWINSTIAFLPLEEQKARRTVDKFWSQMAEIDVRYEADKAALSDRWEAGLIDGPSYRDELSALKRERAYAYDVTKTQSEFSNVAGGIGIPDSPPAIKMWREKFGATPPLIHPVDEVLERYNAVDPEAFRSPLSGEIEWHLFFAEQQRILDDAPDPIRSIAESELAQRAQTPAERALFVSQDLIRQYYGVQDDIVAQLKKTNPQLEIEYQTVQQYTTLSKRATTEEEAALWKSRAMQVLAQNPQLSLIKTMVRKQREQLRASNPEMELAYQMWIATPQLPTTTTTGRRRLPRTRQR